MSFPHRPVEKHHNYILTRTIIAGSEEFVFRQYIIANDTLLEFRVICQFPYGTAFWT